MRERTCFGGFFTALRIAQIIRFGLRALLQDTVAQIVCSPVWEDFAYSKETLGFASLCGFDGSEHNRVGPVKSVSEADPALVQLQQDRFRI
jgi:hypothetical protein